MNTTAAASTLQGPIVRVVSILLLIGVWAVAIAAAVSAPSEWRAFWISFVILWAAIWISVELFANKRLERAAVASSSADASVVLVRAAEVSVPGHGTQGTRFIPRGWINHRDSTIELVAFPSKEVVVRAPREEVESTLVRRTSGVASYPHLEVLFRDGVRIQAIPVVSGPRGNLGLGVRKTSRIAQRLGA